MADSPGGAGLFIAQHSLEAVTPTARRPATYVHTDLTRSRFPSDHIGGTVCVDCVTLQLQAATEIGLIGSACVTMLSSDFRQSPINLVILVFGLDFRLSFFGFHHRYIGRFNVPASHSPVAEFFLPLTD
jgi:hypothetical protein